MIFERGFAPYFFHVGVWFFLHHNVKNQNLFSRWDEPFVLWYVLSVVLRETGELGMGHGLVINILRLKVSHSHMIINWLIKNSLLNIWPRVNYNGFLSESLNKLLMPTRFWQRLDYETIWVNQQMDITARRWSSPRWILVYPGNCWPSSLSTWELSSTDTASPSRPWPSLTWREKWGEEMSHHLSTE